MADVNRRSPIPILMYHQVDAPPPAGAPYRSLSVAPASFARQMGLMAALGWRGLSMTALQPYLRGEQPGMPPVKRRMYPTKQIAAAEQLFCAGRIKDGSGIDF